MLSSYSKIKIEPDFLVSFFQEETGERVITVSFEKRALLIVRQFITEPQQSWGKIETEPLPQQDFFTRGESFQKMGLAYMLTGIIYDFLLAQQGRSLATTQNWVSQLEQRLSGGSGLLPKI